jgi:PhnB protein
MGREVSQGSFVAPGEPVLTPYICPRDCAQAIEWYADVLGAVEKGPRHVTDDGRIGHAMLDIGGSPLMLADASPESRVAAPVAEERTATYALYLYVPNVDATLSEARRKGADVYRPAEDEPFGARLGAFFDPFGVRWMVATYRGAAQ